MRAPGWVGGPLSPLLGVLFAACAVAPEARECSDRDVVCLTGGYAHFTIESPPGSGLPNEAFYEVSESWVRDAVTGLVWERGASLVHMGWGEASERCDALELGEPRRFRLPTRIELVTLLTFERVPAIAEVFEGRAEYYWTASPAAVAEGSAYSVYFGSGETTIADASPGRALVRCVSKEVVRQRTPQFEADASTVRDRKTGLVWERTLTASAPFSEAAARCATTSMRLPSIRELQSIVDERRTNPAIDLEWFPETPAEGFWSASERGQDPWYVDFADGKTYADRFAEEPLLSRCVRWEP